MNLLLYWLRDAWARFTRTLDWPLLLALGALMAIGLAVLYSAGNESPRLVLAQGLRYAFGAAALWALSRLPPHRLRNATPLFYALSILPLFAVLLVGSGKHGNLWINLGVFYFQPSELWKLALPMMLAWHLDRGPLPPRFQAVLVAAVLIWRNPGFQKGYAERTGLRRMSNAPDPASADEQQELTGILTVAAALAADGWRHQVQLLSDTQAGGAQGCRDDEYRGYDDGGLAGEAGERFGGCKNSSERQREQRDHGCDVDADALADEQGEGAGEDGQERDVLDVHEGARASDGAV